MALGYVRPARHTDAAEIARIQLSTWRTAYRRIVPAQVLDQLDEAWLTERWQQAIDAPPSPRHRVLVAIEQGERDELVGFAASGPVEEDALAPDETGLPTGTGALTDLLVEPRWGRRGHGSRLLAATVASWRDDGFARAYAWAFERDVATHKFLASTGWATDGAVRGLDMDGIVVRQQRLHVDLTVDPADQVAGEGATADE